MLTRDHIFSKVISRVWKGTNDVITFVAKQSVGPKEEQMKTKVLTFSLSFDRRAFSEGHSTGPKIRIKALMGQDEPH